MVKPSSLSRSRPKFDRSNKFERPLYDQVAQRLIELIQRDFEPGHRFFPDRKVVQPLQASQQTVRRALDELVRQGMLARRIGSGTTVLKKHPGRHLGLFLPEWPSAMRSAALESFAMLSESFDFSVTVHCFRRGQPVAEMVKNIWRSPDEERIVFLGATGELATALCKATGKLGYRSVLAAPALPDYPGSSVSVDNAVCVDLAVDHLMALGHRRIVFLINEPIVLNNIVTRVQRIREIISERKLTHARIVDCGLQNWSSSSEAAYRKMDEIIAMNPAPTALFCVSGVGAWAALRYCAERRIEVPTRLSVIGVDNLQGSEWLFPPLTTLSFDHNLVARPVIELLWGDDSSPRHITVRPELVVRSSTGQAPRGRDRLI